MVRKGIHSGTSSQSPLKQLQVKHNSMRRLQKDLEAYRKEVMDYDKIIESQKASGADYYELKRNEELKLESLVMVADIEERLQLAYKDINDFILFNFSNYISVMESDDVAENDALPEVQKITQEMRSIKTFFSVICSEHPTLGFDLNAFETYSKAPLYTEEEQEEV